MTRLILHIYDFLKVRARLRWTSLLLLTTVLALLLTGGSYKEDISDFLPLDSSQQQALLDKQSQAGAQRIYVLFQDADSASWALSRFCEVLERVDTAQVVDYATTDDPEAMEEAMGTLYARMPYLLTAADYARIDSMMAEQDFISRKLEDDKQMLMLPSAGMMASQIRHDPLGLFTPVLERLRPAMATRQMLFVDSPYGASETEQNARLVALLQQVCDSVNAYSPHGTVHLTGGPVIAVGNARQIKHDSMMGIALAAVLILLLLWRVFRQVRHLLLIALSIGWGWLFALGCLTLVHNDVSVIVIGISSIIVGIAANYPLHLIAHCSHTPDMRSALKEIVMPLVVGNITTVGAFLALVPLNAVALRDLGLFSAFLLIGTILFVLLWLPHMVQQTSGVRHQTSDIFSRMGNVSLENKSWLVWLVVTLTVVLGYFSLQTSFDADLRNINFMTDEQRHDMQQLEQVVGAKTEQADLSQWNAWRSTQGALLCRQLKEMAPQTGFADGSFQEFYKLIAATPADEASSLTAAIISNLSSNFNYIGWVCGFIVFFFLWFSLGCIELALLSFLPMAVSWVWILGLMALLGIQFNVVNVILATFIFGQGDDYTIFMTEGCQFEYAYRRKLLASYKNSIIISALIMFIGIGALIIARHPALFSLAEVTMIGMFSVVLMAYLFPPLIFRWLVSDAQGLERRQPITLRRLLMPWHKNDCYQLVSDRYRYRGVEISMAVNRQLRRLRKSAAADCRFVTTQQENRIQDNGWGETALLTALQHPDQTFVALLADDDRLLVARHAAEHLAPNLRFMLNS